MADSDYRDSPSPGSPDRDESDQEENTPAVKGNKFQNDGSFLEMFKRLQEGKAQEAPVNDQKVVATLGGSSSKSASTIPQPKKPPLSFVGKRRGGRILATGMVKKQRKETDNKKGSGSNSGSNSEGGGKSDAWSQYMNEVKKYREQICEEEDKRRPLVK